MTAIEEMERQCALLMGSTEDLGGVDEDDVKMLMFRMELSLLSMRCRIEEAKQLTRIADNLDAFRINGLPIENVYGRSNP